VRGQRAAELVEPGVTGHLDEPAYPAHKRRGRPGHRAGEDQLPFDLRVELERRLARLR